MHHVVFVVSGLNMGGMESQLTSLLETPVELSRHWRVTLLTLTRDRNEELVRRLEKRGVRIVLVDRQASGFPQFLFRLVRAIRHEEPDVVHTLLSGSSGTWGRVAARLAGVPRVAHSDRSLNPINTRVHRLIGPIIDRFTDTFFTNARAVASRIEASGIPAAKIELVPNGVALDRFLSADGTRLRSDWGVGPTDLVVGYLGMFRAEKRPQLLLEALELLSEADAPTKVVFAGDGALKGELQELAARNRWSDRVHFAGLISDTAEFLAAIDIMALTSDTEGLPNAVIEAMAAAKPLVATRVSDVPDLVTDNGFVVEPRDAGGLADALARVARMPSEERRRLGAAGRVRAEALYGLEASATRFWEAHERLVAKARA